MPGRLHFSAWNSDRLEHDNAERVRLHLCADLAHQEKLVRFIGWGLRGQATLVSRLGG